jgi:hypothetical protein
MANKILLFCPICGLRLDMSIIAEITGDAEITGLLPYDDVPTPDPSGYRTFRYRPETVRLWCDECGERFDVDEAVRREARPNRAVGRPREESA